MVHFPRLDDIPTDRWPALVEENAVEGCRVWSGWPELDVRQEHDVIYTFSRTGFALFNNVLRSQFDADEFSKRCESVLKHYREAGVPMLWWTGPATQPADTARRLQQEGLRSIGKTIGMVVNLAGLDNSSFASDETPMIEEIDDLHSLKEWSDVMTSVYSFPEIARALWFELHAALDISPESAWRHFLALVRGRPVATASLFAGRQSAALANVATLPEYRHKGFGRTITLVALQAAVESKYQIGTLYSSPEAASIYRSIGFQEVCQAECFHWTPE